MAEVLAQFADPVAAPDGRTYTAQACGAPMHDGLWEGWIEFLPTRPGAPLRSPRETTQPNRVDTEYWATGLTAVYLEGALQRALHPLTRRAATIAEPAFDGPAPHAVAPPAVSRARAAEARAIVDPYSLYEKGETLLRSELTALSAWHLVNIIEAYELSDESVAALNRLPASALVELIVSAVRQTAGNVRM